MENDKGPRRDYRSRKWERLIAVAICAVAALLTIANDGYALPGFGKVAALSSTAAIDPSTGGRADGSDGRPAVAGDGQGNWVAVWDSENDPDGLPSLDSDILVVRSADNGKTWSAPAAIDGTPAGDALAAILPSIDTDGSGRIRSPKALLNSR